MSDHMNSPKVRKALEAYRAAKAEFDVKQAELVKFIEEHSHLEGNIRVWDFKFYADAHRHESLCYRMGEAFSQKNSRESEVSTSLWGYFKRQGTPNLEAAKQIAKIMFEI